MMSPLDYAGKIYSSLPQERKDMIRAQTPKAKKFGNKIVNLLQRRISLVKNTDEEIGRFQELQAKALEEVLAAVEKAVELVKNFENYDAPATASMDPIPHHNYGVIPEDESPARSAAPQPKAKAHKAKSTPKTARKAKKGTRGQ